MNRSNITEDEAIRIAEDYEDSLEVGLKEKKINAPVGKEPKPKLSEHLALRPRKAASVLDISIAQLYIEMKEGRIPYVIRGTMRLLPVEGLRAWLRGDK